jgi:hypothetical protein
LSWIPHILSLMPLQMNLCENILTLESDDDWCKQVKDFIRHNIRMVPRFEYFTMEDDVLLRLKVKFRYH